MKKRNLIILIIVFIIVILLAIIFITTKQNKNTKNQNEIIDNNGEYYMISYSSTYKDYKILGNDENFEVITNETELKKILNEIGSQDDNKFDSQFFDSYNLLVIQAGVDTEVNNIECDGEKADVRIYYASPMSTDEQIMDFDFYLVPINKNIDSSNVNMELLPYPNRLY